MTPEADPAPEPRRAGMRGLISARDGSIRASFSHGTHHKKRMSSRETRKTKRQLMDELQEARRENACLERKVSECREIEEALRESEQRLSLFIENAPAAIAMFDSGMRYLSVSRRWLSDYGLGDRDIIGKSHYEVFPEIPERWREIHRRALTGEPHRCEEDPFPRLDGRTDWVRWEILPWHKSTGEVSGIIIFTEVITNRKEAEEELIKYRDLLEDRVRERTAELEQRGRKLAEEISERLKAEQGKRRMEAQLAQAQRIEALDRFAGGIAHDLNNILSPIMMNIEELLVMAQPVSEEHELLNQTMKAVLRQKDLIKKILSFGRRSDEELKPVRVCPLVDETLDFLRSTLPSTVDIRQDMGALSDTIMGDPTQIQQVIVNLVQNGADALVAQKGTIKVGLMNVHVDESHAAPGDFLELTVRDSGSGMPPDVLARVFEPFFTTKGVGKGTGLGLSVVYGIVKNHHGEIRVESVPGKGTRFTVRLPICQADPEIRQGPAEGTIPDDGRGKILVVDDEEIILSSLQRVLKSSGYRVVAVSESDKALQLFSRTPGEFDLVITDLTMPGMTGAELAGKLLKMRPKLPIILCTGFNDAIDTQQAESLGIRELLLKPTGSRELKSAVSRALSH
jgi:PAS domain S-box-containing protein